MSFGPGKFLELYYWWCRLYFICSLFLGNPLFRCWISRTGPLITLIFLSYFLSLSFCFTFWEIFQLFYLFFNVYYSFKIFLRTLLWVPEYSFFIKSCSYCIDTMLSATFFFFICYLSKEVSNCFALICLFYSPYIVSLLQVAFFCLVSWLILTLSC